MQRALALPGAEPAGRGGVHDLHGVLVAIDTAVVGHLIDPGVPEAVVAAELRRAPGAGALAAPTAQPVRPLREVGRQQPEPLARGTLPSRVAHARAVVAPRAVQRARRGAAAAERRGRRRGDHQQRRGHDLLVLWGHVMCGVACTGVVGLGPGGRPALVVPRAQGPEGGDSSGPPGGRVAG